ncbi:MAG: glutamyl-tRNA reductase [Syntrophales bacterium]|nr:glutamyl-tRNA reductase [Syntrophales bacterium]
MKIVLLGMNHKTAPLELRERLSIACDDERGTVRDVKNIPHIKEAFCVSTCNRVEVLVHTDDVNSAVARLKNLIYSLGNLTVKEMAACLYTYRDEDAVRHLFKVASGIDSLIMGEPQILGQVKEAYRLCVEEKVTGVILNKLLHHAFRTAKRVRTETAISANAVSVGYAAVELSKKIFGSLEEKSVLLVGAGEMAELAARHLVERGVNEFTVINRTYDKALRLAGEFRGKAAPFDVLEEQLGKSDIVISSTGAPGFIIDRTMIEKALRRRKNRLLFLIDIALPRDINPDAGEIDNVYLYNIDDLQNIADRNLKNRREEADKARRIIDEEVGNFQRWHATLQVVPTIIELRSKIDDITKGEFTRSISWMRELREEERFHIEALVQSVINKILHLPVTNLKEISENGGSDQYVAVVRELFGLEKDRHLK